jgi:hypothetical protein
MLRDLESIDNVTNEDAGTVGDDSEVSAYDCKSHPMKPKNLANGDWLETSEAAPSGMTICKALAGKKVCMSAQGRKALKEKFTKKKAFFMAKRNSKLALFKTMGDDYVKTLGTTVNVVADVVAEAASAAMLGARIFINAVTQWDCKYTSEGELNMDDCPNRENETEWLA